MLRTATVSIDALRIQDNGDTRLPKTRDPEPLLEPMKHFNAAKEADMSYVVLDRTYSFCI
jgi:hypothetical protein